MFNNIYKDKKILVTGDTGFKGSWLVTWLLKLGAEVVGVSRDIPTQPSMFEESELAGKIKHIQVDIRDLNKLDLIIKDEKFDFIFHLAAQAIVSSSYMDPVDTITTNVIGTMNVLESLRHVKTPCVAILITSDKCYDNKEWLWGYRETDHLGGKDIYSGSKGSAELIINSYVHSFFKSDHPVRIAVGRAGNVIGGGDWAKDRIVVDCMQAWNENRSVEIRSPMATRPWQHVLEPLSGYLILGQSLAEDQGLHGEAFNFGPQAGRNHTVVELLQDLGKYWGFNDPADAYKITDNIPFHEAGLLKLNCDKALCSLEWESNLDYDETIQLVGNWYKAFYKDKVDTFEYTIKQIDQFEGLGLSRNRKWAE